MTGFITTANLNSNTTTYTNLNTMITDSATLKNNITNLSNRINDNIDNDILDNNGNLKPDGRLVDVARQDVQLMLIQQNTLYMLGTITIATLLITAILISK